MDYEEIKKLINDMGNSNIDELNIEFPDGIKIGMKKSAKNNIDEIGTQIHTFNQKEISNTITETKKETKKEEIENSKIVKSPMVGTFYSKPSPDAKEYVKVGDKVSKGDVLCIVEAMKLMNEIESEFDGEIIEIMVIDGESVEFGKPLFKIK